MKNLSGESEFNFMMEQFLPNFIYLSIELWINMVNSHENYTFNTKLIKGLFLN